MAWELAPNQPVSVGDEGLLNRPGSGDWTTNGAEGVDFEAFPQVPTVDFGTFHLYPDHWGKSPAWGND